jgi:hypothetical protein
MIVTEEKSSLANIDSLPPAVYGNDIFDAISATGFLPRIQLMGSNTQAVKEGKFPMGHYALIKGRANFVDLGSTVHMVPVAWRPKALEINGDTVISNFQHGSPEFKRIQAQSAVAESGCMYGAEYLVYIPEQSCWATFFFGNKTMRNVAPQVKQLLDARAGVTFTVQLIKNTKYSWHGPVVASNTTEVALPGDMVDVVNQFTTPPQSTVEKADQAPERG